MREAGGASSSSVGIGATERLPAARGCDPADPSLSSTPTREYVNSKWNCRRTTELHALIGALATTARSPGEEVMRVHGVNKPAYMGRANIQFVPSRLGSAAAAAQFLPIDLLLPPRHRQQSRRGAAPSHLPPRPGTRRSRERRWGIEPRPAAEMRCIRGRGGGASVSGGVVAVTKRKHLGIG